MALDIAFLLHIVAVFPCRCGVNEAKLDKSK